MKQKNKTKQLRAWVSIISTVSQQSLGSQWLQVLLVFDVNKPCLCSLTERSRKLWEECFVIFVLTENCVERQIFFRYTQVGGMWVVFMEKGEKELAKQKQNAGVTRESNIWWRRRRAWRRVQRVSFRNKSLKR